MPKGAPKQRLIQAFGQVMGATSLYTKKYVSLARSTKKKGGGKEDRKKARRKSSHWLGPLKLKGGMYFTPKSSISASSLSGYPYSFFPKKGKEG